MAEVVDVLAGLESAAAAEDPGFEVFPAFYLDLRSPEAYLASELVRHVLPYAAEWVPVRSLELAAPDTLEGFRCEADALAYRESVEARVRAAELQPVRWPATFPGDSEQLLLAATYAKQIGRVVAYVHAAFRQVYAGGRELGSADTVVIAGSACEMHPTATLKAIGTRGVRDALAANTALAVERGVRDVPAVWLPDGRVFHGVDGLAEAAEAVPGAG